jgi:hypothetical protein
MAGDICLCNEDFVRFMGGSIEIKRMHIQLSSQDNENN